MTRQGDAGDDRIAVGLIVFSRGASVQTTSHIYRQIDRALQTGDMPLATRLARQALDAGLVHPALLHLRAIWKKQSGLAESGFADVQQALAMMPRAPELLTEAADSLNAMGEFQRALVLAQEAISVDPAYAAAWHQKGYAHHMRTELDAAREAFLEAVRHDSRIADAYARLANIAAEQGHLAEARKFAGRALAVEPDNALAILASVTADLAEKRLEDARRQLDKVLSDPVAPLSIRAAAKAKTGDVCDALGETAEAFEAYRSAGELWKQCYEQQVRRSGRQPVAAQIGRIMSALEAEPPRQWQ